MNYDQINKQNLPNWESTLKYLTNILKQNNIKYYLSSSGLHYIQGEEIYPYDIDLFMAKESVKKMYNPLKEYSISNLHYWEEDNREYLEFQGKYNNIPFEICEWKEEPKEVVIKKFKDIEIYIIETHI